MNIVHVIANEENLKKGKHMLPLRYTSFQSVLSKNNEFSFIPYNLFRTGLESNVAIQHFTFNGKNFIPGQLKSLEADIAQIEYYDAVSPEEKIKDMSESVPRLTSIKGIQLINNQESLKSQDKKFLFDYQDKLFISPPTTYYFESSKEVLNKLNLQASYVIKPRLGSESRGVKLETGENIYQVENIENYIVQEEQKNIIGELRLVFGMGEFLGSRFMHDRKKPWENLTNKDGKKFHNIPIKPSDEIISYAHQIYQFSKCEFASVDLYVIDQTSKVKQHSTDELKELLSAKSQLKLVEVNGFGTGFGNPSTNNYFAKADGSIGELNTSVANTIAKLNKAYKPL